MKEKNKRVYKLSAVLMILCLITACVIGTTLAKYTTGGSATDSASVAKWGVKVQIQGDGLFSNEYKNGDGTATVSSLDNRKVVAAGTSGGGASSSMKFAIEGTPEVSTKVVVSLTDVKDVCVKKGTYTDPIEKKSVEVTADYYPIVFTLKQIKDAKGTCDKIVATGTLAQIKAVLDAYTANATYEPTTNLQAEFELSWKWEFESGHDAYDTLLGNFAADPNFTPNDNVSINVGYKLEVTVTQVD